MKQHQTVVILDYGSQYTQLIARRVRELGIYSVVLPGSAHLNQISEHHPRAIILSGGPSSVYDQGAPTLPEGLLAYQLQNKVGLLGVCYGMQLLAHSLGGKVTPAEVREYGLMKIIRSPSMLVENIIFSEENETSVWMSHGDEISVLPKGFEVVARSQAGALAAIQNKHEYRHGIQFHPEVTHTPRGLEMIQRFLTNICKIQPDWQMKDVIQEQIEIIQKTVGPTDHVICALSGGVDSTVAACLVHQAIGNRLHCVFVDHGLLRLDEQKRVMKMFEEKLHLPVECVDASQVFLKKLAGVVDPEQKRKIIGKEFIVVFDEAAERIAKKIGTLPKYLVQGTLYPDVIESSPAPLAQGSAKKHSTTIKSHHNVGGLPSDLKFKLIEPLRALFKDEVRSMGKELGIPASFLERHPFPGPGLAVRIIGEITEEALEILKKVDDIFIECIREAGLYNEIWQAFAVFLPIRSVGVQGDGRTHDYVVALRAVTSRDGMTADWYAFDAPFLAKVSSKICNEVRGVNRVVYDISSKPPATIEWE